MKRVVITVDYNQLAAFLDNIRDAITITTKPLEIFRAATQATKNAEIYIRVSPDEIENKLEL